MFLKLQATFLVVLGVLVYQVYSAIDQPCNSRDNCSPDECCLIKHGTGQLQQPPSQGTCQKLGDLDTTCLLGYPPFAQGPPIDHMYCRCRPDLECTRTPREREQPAGHDGQQYGPPTGTCQNPSGPPNRHNFGPDQRPGMPFGGVRRRR